MKAQRVKPMINPITYLAVMSCKWKITLNYSSGICIELSIYVPVSKPNKESSYSQSLLFFVSRLTTRSVCSSTHGASSSCCPVATEESARPERFGSAGAVAASLCNRVASKFPHLMFSIILFLLMRALTP